jgi:hypothetical protein
MKSSFHILIPVLPLLSTQFNPIQSNPIQSNPIQSNPIQFNSIQFNSSAPKLISWQAGVSKLDTSLNGHNWTLLYNHFTRTTQKTQPLYRWEGMFTAPFPGNGSYSIVACVFVAAGMCLPSSFLAKNVFSDFTISAFGCQITVPKRNRNMTYRRECLTSKWGSFCPRHPTSCLFLFCINFVFFFCYVLPTLYYVVFERVGVCACCNFSKPLLFEWDRESATRELQRLVCTCYIEYSRVCGMFCLSKLRNCV